MLWDSVYEFFVKYVFGGYLSLGGEPKGYYASIGFLFDNGDLSESWTSELNLFDIGGGVYMSMGNYLSLIATIITMVIVVTLCALFIWKIIKLVGGLVR